MPALALLAALAWRFWPGRAPLPYEGVNDPPAGLPARPRPDAGLRLPADAAPADAVPLPGAAATSATELVDVTTLAPSLVIDLRYATPDNFLGRAVYPPGARALLRRDAAERLARVQAGLRARGLGLKIFDAYRPLAVQRAMWALVPDPRYVADPARGGRHNRAAAVDVTLVDATGRELSMPTAFDDFSPRAAADAPAGREAAAHRAILRTAMEAEGFTVMPTEWWHFDAPGWAGLSVLDVPVAATPPRSPDAAPSR